MIFINSRDDPLVPEDLLIPIQNFASKLIIKICKNVHLIYSVLTITIEKCFRFRFNLVPTI